MEMPNENSILHKAHRSRQKPKPPDKTLFYRNEKNQPTKGSQINLITITIPCRASMPIDRDTMPTTPTRSAGKKAT